ncbi:hypothetical protein BGX33_010339 [Mortierella sp. NVP41]|nr:hypothetical protein BGX33_010339 [Mortierella sp. NVP41]
MPMGMFDGDDDDDDFEPLTPCGIRLRNPTPPPKRPAPVSSSQQQRQQRQKQQQQQSRSHSTLTPKSAHSDHTQGMSRLTSSQASITAVPSTSKPRTGILLSLKKPAPKSNPNSQIAHRVTNGNTRSSTTASHATVKDLPTSPESSDAGKDSVMMIVVDSESEGHSDVDTVRRTAPSSGTLEIALVSTQIGGVQCQRSPSRSGSAQDDRRTQPISIPHSEVQHTQESIASSQGSVDLPQDLAQPADTFPAYEDPALFSDHDHHDSAMDYSHDHKARWSLSPQIENPIRSDLVATTTSARTSPIPETAPAQPSSPSLSDVDDDATDTPYSMTISITSTMQTDDYLPSTLGGDDMVECVVCGKLLTHLDSARVEYHINNCIDEQQQYQDAAQSLDLKTDLSRISASQGEFAGAQFDYLARVKRCPICKLDWPLKGKAKAGTATPPRKARHKVEHMKRCAKSNKRTIQSVLYQVRLLKERYERSLVLGTPIESDPLGGSQDAGREPDAEERDQSSDEIQPEELQTRVRRKPKAISTTKKQVVSLADNVDADFSSDAIITTVHAPTPVQPKMTKLQRMHQDQQDDGLQLALAISMSMCDPDSGIPTESNSGSPSGTPGPSTSWSMTPAVVRKGTKRRKQTDRDRNETTVLPFAEIQHLIQNNVQALLFPDIEESAVPEFSSDDHDSNGASMRTPPWGPSRFTGDTSDADVEVNLSQSSEAGMTSPVKSLWNLSHLKDTRSVDNPDQQEAQPVEGEQESRVARIEPGSGFAFDNDKYVSRFMRRYIRQEQKDMSRSSPSAEPADSVVSDQGSSKFTSPLWSVSRSRRISFKEQREEMDAKALKSEIVGHLDEMQRTIQQAKRVAYFKILESIERHPVAAARLTPSRSQEPVIIKESNAPDNNGVFDEDTATFSQDVYQGPSSPLLRYSKVLEAEEPVPPRPLSASPSPPPSRNDPVEDKVDSPVREALSQDLNKCCNVEDTVDDYEPYQDDDFSVGIMMYSPSPPRQGNNSPSPPRQGRYSLTPPLERYSPTPPPERYSPTPPPGHYSPPPRRDRYSTPPRQDRYSASPRQQPDSPPTITIMNSYKAARPTAINRRPPPAKPSRGKKKAKAPPVSSPGDLSADELPPPLDFAKLGYPINLADPGSPDNDAFDATHLDQESRWANVTTPKKPGQTKDATATDADSPLKMPRRPRSSYKIGKLLLPARQVQQEMTKRKAASSSSIQLDPLPPTSAVGGEGGIEELSNWPTVSQRIAARRKAALQDAGESSSSQPMAAPQGPALGSSGHSALVESYRKAAARARQAAQGSSQTMALSQSLSFSQSQTQTQPSSQSGTRTPSKKLSRAAIRAQEFAAEAARAVETMKLQETMPNYSKMTVSTLRMFAMSFGLKATTKALLVDQLTAIWESVHSGTPKSDEQRKEGDGAAEDGSNDGESSSRGGQLELETRRQQDWDRDRDRERVEPVTRSGRLSQDDPAPPSPPFQSVDDTAPGYMSPILTDSDDAYNNNDNHYDYDNDYETNFDMDYDNNYQNFDNDLDNHDAGRYDYGLNNDLNSDPGEPFVNTKCGGAKGGHQKDSYKDVDAGAGGDDEAEESDDEEDDEHDLSQLSAHDDDDEDGGDGEEGMECSDQEEPVVAPPTLERQLFDFLNKATHLRKQYLTYKPLDLELVWEECTAAQIRCTRQQLRQFLDKQSIICFVPAHSTLQSWHKTRSKKRKRAHP